MNPAIDPVRAFAACALLFGAISNANAEDASRWNGDARTAARLIAGSRGDPASPIRAGVEIKLSPGWHTYWRYPGDAGVPPQFDFSESENVRAVNVLWPAPRSLPEAGITAIGYDHDVILPLRVVPEDAGMPVTLRLKLNYAICERLCVPAEAEAELALRGGASALDGDLAAAEARVPTETKLDDNAPLAVRAVRQEGGFSRPHVTVDVAAPAGAKVDLFAEGPSPQWALPVPSPVAGAPAGQQRFVFELDGAPPGVSYEGALITLTAVAGDQAIEVTTRLD